MTMFHWTGGAVAPLSAIAAARDDDATGEIVVTKQDGSVQRWPGSLDRLLSRAVQLIPAEPGWNLVVAWMENNIAHVRRTPVIAWALCGDGEIRPVTPGGIGDGDHRGPWERFGHYVETANGQIIAAGPDLEPSSFAGVGELAAARSKWEKSRGLA